MYILLIFIIINLLLTIKYKSISQVLNLYDHPDGERKALETASPIH